MNLKDATRLVRDEHVRQAAKLVRDHDLAWLYERTGRQQPKYRYVVVDGFRFPAKAFGFLVAQLAGGTDSKSNIMNVNEAVAPLKRLGYTEVRGLEPARTDAEEQAREVSYHQALSRPSQARFRQTLLSLSGGRCAISGVLITTALEAAHVQPFRDKGLDHPSNGLLLRADLHKLFDSGELAIDPGTLKARFSAAARQDYSQFESQLVVIPQGGPEARAFEQRWKEFQKVTVAVAGKKSLLQQSHRNRAFRAGGNPPASFARRFF